MSDLDQRADQIRVHLAAAPPRTVKGRDALIDRIGLHWFGEMRLPEMRDQIAEFLDFVETDSEILEAAEHRGAIKALARVEALVESDLIHYTGRTIRSALAGSAFVAQQKQD